MKAGELVCALLLLACGASNAKPQYTAQGTQHQQPVVQTAVEQVSGSLANPCREYEDCVPRFNCNPDGSINTDGAGVIDIRTPPRKCQNPKYPTVDAVCCRIPGAPVPLRTCNANQDCVEYGQCGDDGSIITDGAGLIDPRIQIKCDLDAEREGICCDLPKPDPVVDCPQNHFCSSSTQCVGTGAAAAGPYVDCYLDYAAGTTGICCESVAPLQTCPVNFECRPQELCSSPSFNGYGLPSECYLPDSTIGVCCEPPAPLQTCTAGHVCANEALCLAPILSNYGTTSSCYLFGSDGLGICCEPPPPLDTCPGDLVCSSQGQCTSPPLNEYGTPSSCYVFGSTDVGTCCDPPAPLDTCPGELVCRSEGLCTSSPLNVYGTPSSCYVSGSTDVGVCCEPPAPLETCPGDWVCRNEEVCANPGLNEYQEYTSCYVGGAIGFCCEPPPPVTKCPGNWQCANEGQCLSVGLNEYAESTACYLGGSQNVGVCCDPPAPLKRCPGAEYCQAEGHCTSPGALNAYGTYSTCLLPGGSGQGICCNPEETCPNDKVCAAICSAATHPTSHPNCQHPFVGTGTCCKPLIPVTDNCPLDSVCTPGAFCGDDALDTNGDFVPYESGKSWMKCPLGHDQSKPAICCRRKVEEKYRVADECGIRNYAINQRITSYTESHVGEFPWLAIIFFSNYTYKCAASIIDNNHILTAAHCVHGLAPGDIQVRLGEHKVNTYDERLPYVDYQISHIYTHPEYNSRNLFNDVAILTVSKPIEFAYNINRVCLPSPALSLTGRCIVSGWGKDSFEGKYQEAPKYIELPVLENGECQNLLRKTRLGEYFQLHKSFLCAGGAQGEDACTGDGGGPLICETTTGSYVQVGIVAWGIGCGQQNVPGVYADVTKLLPYITGVLSGQQQQQQQQQPQTPGGPYGK